MKSVLENLLNNNRREVGKRFIVIFLPLLTFIIIISIISLWSVHRYNTNDFKYRGKIQVSLIEKEILINIDRVFSDLFFLSNNSHLQAFLDNGKTDNQDALARDFLIFSENKRTYDQIRFLNEHGIEMVRVNFNDGKPAIVPKNQLQDKRNRYYFKETYQVKSGEVFISPLDLNIEKGQIELPLKPMIRIGTPVFGNRGDKRGIVLLNYLGQKLLNLLEPDSSKHYMLLNTDGFWLKGPTVEDEWGFMYDDRGNKTFKAAFPAAWQMIATEDTGQLINDYGLFTFTTIYPFHQATKAGAGSGKHLEPNQVREVAKNYSLKLVSLISPN
jgi:hypothetical protein